MDQVKATKILNKLVKDTKAIQLLLKNLEEDHAVWERTGQEEDLKSMLEALKQLEIDVGVILATCSSMSNEYGRDGVGEALRKAYVYLDALFSDVKRARNDLHSAYITPGDLEHIEVDWARLKNTADAVVQRLECNGVAS